MTYQSHCTVPDEILEQIANDGFDALPELLRILFNTAMQAGREKYLGVRMNGRVGPAARPCQRLQAEESADARGLRRSDTGAMEQGENNNVIQPGCRFRFDCSAQS